MSQISVILPNYTQSESDSVKTFLIRMEYELSVVLQFLARYHLIGQNASIDGLSLHFMQCPNPYQSLLDLYHQINASNQPNPTA